MTDLQPTGLAFGRLKIWSLLGYKSTLSLILVNREQCTGDNKATCMCNFLLGASALPSVQALIVQHMLPRNYQVYISRWGILWPRVQDGYSDAVTQGRTSPLSSHGSCKPIDESPYCTEGAMQLGR